MSDVLSSRSPSRPGPTVADRGSPGVSDRTSRPLHLPGTLVSVGDPTHEECYSLGSDLSHPECVPGFPQSTSTRPGLEEVEQHGRGRDVRHVESGQVVDVPFGSYR